MKKVSLLVALIVSMAVCNSIHADQTAEEILRAVVKIKAVVPKEAQTASTLGTEREGNGVLIDAKGHILTIGYLIVEAESLEVIDAEGKSISATFVGYDHATGFGLLRAEASFKAEPMKLGDSSKVKGGDPVLVAGHGGKDSAQAAQVLVRKEFAGYWEYLLEDAIFTAPAYSSFGGAALIGPEGNLLGIGSLFTPLPVPGLGSIPCNVFVPINLLPPILNDLITHGRPRQAPRPWLGINVEEAHGRVFITRLTSGGPSEKANLKVGDLILSVSGKEVTGIADFYRKVWALGSAGIEVPLSILQGAQIRTINVRSSDRYQFLNLKPKKVL